MFGFSNIMGAIDCTHVAVRVPINLNVQSEPETRTFSLCASHMWRHMIFTIQSNEPGAPVWVGVKMPDMGLIHQRTIYKRKSACRCAYAWFYKSRTQFPAFEHMYSKCMDPTHCFTNETPGRSAHGNRDYMDGWPAVHSRLRGSQVNQYWIIQEARDSPFVS